jgi:hypothetical protein
MAGQRPNPGDVARRDETRARLQRWKSGIAAATAALIIAFWAFVSGSVANAAAAADQAATPAPAVTTPDGGFFDRAPALSDATGQVPVLKSHGS